MERCVISRSDWAGGTCILILLTLALFLMSNGVSAQEELNAIKTPENGWLQYTDAPNSLYHHLTNQAFELLDGRSRIIAGIQSLPAWQERQQFIAGTLREIIGPFPEKTPLDPKIVRIIEKDDYHVEHIVYESQPGFFVTSSLYMPLLKGKRKAPAVIYCSGHTNEGYRSKVYQHVIVNLVKKGFIVLAFDPVGQGERSEYLDAVTGKPSLGGTTNEHSYAGAQAFITGSSYARYMIWDGIRAVDYLMTRKEVDPARIGITGRSGGGTQSAFIAAMDDRILAAAPECYITSFTRLLQSIGPQDAEQNLFHEIFKGIDHADLLTVRAPKPALIITTTRDFFSIQGARETAQEVRRIYSAYDRKDNFAMVEDDGPHESTRRNREAMYAFFQKNLNNPGSPEDLDVEIPGNEELVVTATGQVLSQYHGETVFSLNRKETANLMNTWVSARKNINGQHEEMIRSARILSGYRDPEKPEEPIFTGRFQRKGYVIEKYFVHGESDYIIPYLLIIPELPNKKGLIYLNPLGKAVDMAPDGVIEWLVMHGFTVLAPDLIGTGETGPGDFKGDSYINGQSYNIWFASILIGRSIVGIQAGDVVRLARYLGKRPLIDEVYGVAIREMSPVLLHAAAFDQIISRVALVQPYSSYRGIVLNRFYDPAFIRSTVAGSLKVYDLPDLSASLAPRKLLMAGTTDGLGSQSEDAALNEDISVIRRAYHSGNADDKLIILPGKPGDPGSYFPEWLK
jgi:cephalosporin-C deacetylase-like acetyl esterase